MAIVGAVKPALAQFPQGVREDLQRRRQERVGPSDDKHMPSAHHPRSKRCSHLRMSRGLPSSGLQLLKRFVCLFVFSGEGVLPTSGAGERPSWGEDAGRSRAASGAGPSRVTSPFPPSPLPGSAPSRSVLGGGRR